MKSLQALRPVPAFSSSSSLSRSPVFLKLTVVLPSLDFSMSSLAIPAPKRIHRSHTALRSQSGPNSEMGDREEEEEEDPDALVEDLRVPHHWLEPSKALEVLIFTPLLLLLFFYFWHILSQSELLI